jgi:benzoylformate decarboxylase
MPENGILVDEGLTSSRYIPSLRAHRDRYGYHALASGGIGWGLPASVGASLANPGRPVVCYVGDGSAMYSIQSLWSAAHHKLPLTVVLINNGGYRIIKQRLLAFHGDDHFVGMERIRPSTTPPWRRHWDWRQCESKVLGSYPQSCPQRSTDRVPSSSKC